MKKLLIILGILVAALAAQSQSKLNWGAGYYSEIVTYQGVITELEIENKQSERFSTMYKVNLATHSSHFDTSQEFAAHVQDFVGRYR